MTVQAQQINIQLPNWLNSWLKTRTNCATTQQRMALVIEASKRNIAESTGGPFAAAVFDNKTGQLISLGVNLVTSNQLSVLHGEIVALTLAQQTLHTYDLSLAGEFELVTSTEPCAMCYGAVVWSGVKRLVTGATDAHARAIGFDEGPKPPHWQQALIDRGIEVITGVLSNEAKQVLDDYQKSGADIYNGRQQ